MLHFDNDYMEGAHPRILARLTQTNMEKTPGYGTDAYSQNAKQKISRLCECPRAAVHFMVGGTQANATVIDALLASYEGVLAAETAHISTHEAGAVELSGHKVLTLPQKDGKITAAAVKTYMRNFMADDNHAHMVAPGMVYISHPTEYGTLYTADELESLHSVCAEYDIPLYLDGARLGYGLMAEGTDVTLPVIAKCCAVFYIGATKVGALFGEAVVIPDPKRIPHFFTIIKQHGGLLAKGRLLGIQFDTLFTDNLYFSISRKAVQLSNQLRTAFMEKGYRLLIDSPTNQLFVILDNDKKNELSEQATFSFWEKYDDNHTVVRFATSWATTEEEIHALIDLL